MGESKEKTKRSFIIVIIVYCISFFSISYLTLINYLNYSKLLEEKNSINDFLINIENKYEIQNNKQNELKETIDNLNNIDNEINVIKNDVFSLASQVEKKILNNETNYKIAYLTFDDGPYFLTKDYIDVLKNKKVKATFFTIGLDKDPCYDNKEASCLEMYKLIVSNNHTIANHTYSHLIRRGLYNSSTSFITEVKKQENLIKERTGVTTNIVRFPGGSSTAGELKYSIINELRNNGYGWVDWTAQDGDGGYVANTTIAWNNFINTINENIEVVLFHDYNNITLSILPQAIEYLEKNNYIILPLFYDSVMVNK